MKQKNSKRIIFMLMLCTLMITGCSDKKVEERIDTVSENVEDKKIEEKEIVCKMTKGEVTYFTDFRIAIEHHINLDDIHLKSTMGEENMYDDEGRILRKLYFSNEEMKYKKEYVWDGEGYIATLCDAFENDIRTEEVIFYDVVKEIPKSFRVWDEEGNLYFERYFKYDEHFYDKQVPESLTTWDSDEGLEISFDANYDEGWENGNIIKNVYYENGEVTDSYEIIYDTNGNITHKKKYGIDSIELGEFGWHPIDSGLTTELDVYDEEEKVITKGFFNDDNGKLDEVFYYEYDDLGNLLSIKQGIEEVVYYTYDEKQNKTGAYKYYDDYYYDNGVSAGKVREYYKYMYDSDNNMILKEHGDMYPDGSTDLSEKTEYFYDENGNLVEERIYDKNSQNLLYMKEYNFFNEQGEICEYCSYDKNGKIDYYYLQNFVYDENGKLRSIIRKGADGTVLMESDYDQYENLCSFFMTDYNGNVYYETKYEYEVFEMEKPAE